MRIVLFYNHTVFIIGIIAYIYDSVFYYVMHNYIYQCFYNKDIFCYVMLSVFL